MVELLGGGGFAVSLCDDRIGEHGGEQPLEVGVGEAVDKTAQADARGRQRRKWSRAADRDLSTSLGSATRSWSIFICRRSSKREAAAAGLDHVAALEVFGDARVAGLPDTAFELAGLVAQNEAEVGLVGLGSALLLGQDEEEAVEELALVEVGQIGDVDVFHSAEKINS